MFIHNAISLNFLDIDLAEHFFFKNVFGLSGFDTT